jgi:hypothetical protein
MRRPGRVVRQWRCKKALHVVGLAALAQPVAGQAAWHLAEAPSLTIGLVDGPAAYVFHDLRGVVVTADGTLVVADGVSRELRTYSPSGEHIRSWGGPGDGPEEFRAIEWIDLCGTGVVAYDLLRRRVSRWELSGTLIEGHQVEGTDTQFPPYSVSCGPNRESVITGWPDVTTVDRTGPYRPRVSVGMVDGEGRLLRIVGTYPGTERYKSANNDGPLPPGRSLTTRIGRDAVYIGTADSFHIERVGLDGTRSSFGLEVANAPVTENVRDAWVETMAERALEPRRPAIRSALRQFALPGTLPAYAGFDLDEEGNLWVSHYPIPGEKAAVWRVFSGDGRWIASIDIPVTFRPAYIAPNFILGVHLDSLGVQTVRRYEVNRSGH